MRVPLSWLREYVDFEWSADELAVRLTGLGMEVQSIEQIGADWSGVVVGQLLDVQTHPTTPRLSLTRVTVGEGEPLDIVCGATNIAVGQRVPVALPGSTLPGGRPIEVTRIAGADSHGMLCSGAELRLTDDADGIMILEGEPALGTPFEELVGDTVLDIDVKPNRGDALSLVGLAREVAALTGGRLRWPPIEVPESGGATSDHLSVQVEAPELCTRFVGRWVDGLAVGPSPLSVQLRLGAAGMRPVSNVVDASNYVMLELGKPIHTFDAASVSGGRIVVRRARPSERMETLDHVERELSTDDLLIADPAGPLGIAGVMGGAGSEVGEGTQAVVVESAIFDPVSIRRTAQRHGLRSEASQRFEKGQEWRLARLGADRTAQLLAAWAGGRAAVGVIDTDPREPAPRRVAFRPARINRLLGADLSTGEMRALLERAEIATEPAPTGADVEVIAGPDGLRVQAAGEALIATVPGHRRDMAIEADVAEEVARLHGYQDLPSALPASQTPPYRPDPDRLVDDLRTLLAGRGLAEMLSYVLVAPLDHARLGYAAADPATIRLANPVTIDHSEMRRSMLPGLTRALSLNERQRRDDVAIFEAGPIHEFRGGEPWQADRLALLLAGNWQPGGWAQPAREADVADAKGMVEWLVERLAGQRAWYRPTEALPGVEHPGRTAEVVTGDAAAPVSLGRVGELDPRYLRTCDLRAQRAVVAVLDIAALAALAAARTDERRTRGPSVERDLAVVVGEDVNSASVENAIRTAAADSLTALRLFDRYDGPPLAAGEVSLAYRLSLEVGDGAAVEAKAEQVVAKVGDALRATLGARIRGREED
ncbi:phenylalanine--tRNA ligase subunit beta [soil metagenome]